MSCDTANTGEIDILHDHIPVAVAKTYKVNRLSASILSYLKREDPGDHISHDFPHITDEASSGGMNFVAGVLIRAKPKRINKSFRLQQIEERYRVEAE
jgi:hypothetical protein